MRGAQARIPAKCPDYMGEGPGKTSGVKTWPRVKQTREPFSRTSRSPKYVTNRLPANRKECPDYRKRSTREKVPETVPKNEQAASSRLALLWPYFGALTE